MNVTNTLIIRITVVTLLVLMKFALPRPSRRNNMPIVLKRIPSTLNTTSPSLMGISIVPRRATPRIRRAIRRSVVARRARRAITVGPGTRPGGGRRIGGPRGARTRGTRRTHGLTTTGTRQRHGRTRRTTHGQMTNTFNGNTRVNDGNSARNRNVRKDPAKGTPSKTASNAKNCNSFGLNKHSLNRNKLPQPMCGIRSRNEIIIAVAIGPTKRIVTADVGHRAGAIGPTLQGTTRSTTGGTHFGTMDNLGGRAKAVACCFGLGWRRRRL